MSNEIVTRVPLGVCLEIVRHPHGSHKEILAELEKVQWTERYDGKHMVCHMDRCIAWLKQHPDLDIGKVARQISRGHWHGY